jgi:5-(carboxyamino)imidazole ribonucleotide mutase
MSIAVVMGSKSDWPTLSKGVELLEGFGVAPLVRIVSAHRTPARLVEFARGAEAAGIKVIIAGAGGAAHLPGMIASMTHLPVLGVPMNVNSLNGMDALLSIVQMPRGVPVGTLAIGEAGAVNAAILAVSILALSDAALREKLVAWRAAQTDSVGDDPR